MLFIKTFDECFNKAKLEFATLFFIECSDFFSENVNTF